MDDGSNLVPLTVTICSLFEEDAVSVKRNGQFRCGVVVSSSEYVSSDDEDGDDEIFNDEKLRRGTVRVAWHPEGTEEVLNENTVSITRPNFGLGSSAAVIEADFAWFLVIGLTKRRRADVKFISAVKIHSNLAQQFAICRENLFVEHVAGYKPI